MRDDDSSELTYEVMGRVEVAVQDVGDPVTNGFAIVSCCAAAHRRPSPACLDRYFSGRVRSRTCFGLLSRSMAATGAFGGRGAGNPIATGVSTGPRSLAVG